MQLMPGIERFLSPQERVWESAMEEIRAGEKSGHWMWYIFPQLRGLGHSTNAWYYGLADLEEARAYLAHPILGGRLREITEALLSLEQTNPVKIFGRTDSMKLRSCMTLFSRAGGDPLFSQVLDRYFAGREDDMTLELLKQKGAYK